jgi:2-hydroxy-3-keto-5-methylthiopentenyl-1-phosphate phosphatase
VTVVVDWDGTVTEEDTLLMVLRQFVSAPVIDALETDVDAKLAAGTITHREVMESEFALLTAPLDAVVAFVVQHARVRPGFAEFVKRFDPLILSSGFHETIEPVLAREGVEARLRANHAEPRADGWRIRWVSDSACDTCGQPCKRRSLPDPPFVYVGDGYSDRCAALAADRIFARDGLARYLDSIGTRYEPFTDFRDVARSLAAPVSSSGSSYDAHDRVARDGKALGRDDHGSDGERGEHSGRNDPPHARAQLWDQRC